LFVSAKQAALGACVGCIYEILVGDGLREPQGGIVTNGKAPTLAVAKAQFAQTWRR
jgi:hypothetical protein